MPVCAICSVPVRRTASLTSDEWVWAGPDGNAFGRDPDLAHIPDPYARLAMLAEVKPLPREYTFLKIRLEFGGTFHQHHPAPDSEPPYEGLVPEHCGWPAWLRPSGWHCRQCNTRLPDAGESLGEQPGVQTGAVV